VEDLIRVFFQNLVVARDTDEEYTARYLLKAMDPFPTFGTLTSNIAYTI
jgi:hypothetical protein